jgi:hypothetical protein
MRPVRSTVARARTGAGGPGRRLGLLPLLALTAAGCSGLLRGYAEGTPDALSAFGSEGDATPGIVRFAFDDLGTLNTDALESHAVPWKLTVAALLLHARDGAEGPPEPTDVYPILRRYGFVVPDTIANWSGAPYPTRQEGPIGLLRGTVRRGFPRVQMEVAGFGCASCHGGVTYDAGGDPVDAVWLGLPNTSLDLGAYTDALYAAYERAAADTVAWIALMDSLYPAMDAQERKTLTGVALPAIVREVPELARRFGTLTPFAGGVPGAPNGVGSLKRALGLLDHQRDDELSMAQTPDLGDRVLRTSLTVDGVYRIPGRPRFAPMTREEVTPAHLTGLARIAAFFTVPAMGGRPDRIEREVPRVRAILEYLRYYRPPAFPGPVDRPLAARGAEVYAGSCAGCHGIYSPGVDDVRLVSFPNRLVPGDQIGTDPVRWRSANEDVLGVLRRVEYTRHLDPAPTGGYVAPPLTGVWATAPYLHNASVPTLWHLMHPDERPARFLLGGHRLDLDRVGIHGVLDDEGVLRYPDGYRPWANPRLYDTAAPGFSNRGHEAEFAGLPEDEKRALLEYLKLL